MNYTQTQAESAVILRSVVSQMSGHEAAFNPLTYTIWYEHVAGINSELSEAMKLELARPERLSDADVLKLYLQFIAPPDFKAMGVISEKLQQTMGGISESVSRTASDAGKFEEQLSSLSQGLESADISNISDLTPHIDRALENTTGMLQSAQALQAQINKSRQEIEALQSDLSRARNEALLDPLTLILNRKGFDQALEDLLKSSADGTHCLVMMDIDHFKTVNDSHGHVMGDRVIQAVGEVLRSIVSEQSRFSAARFGGDEFAVLMPDTRLHFAANLADNIRSRIKDLKIRNRRTQDVILTITVSIGLTCLTPEDDSTTLVDRAESALYKSKQAGRDRVTCV
jgi:diguanylate cyclase